MLVEFKYMYYPEHEKIINTYKDISDLDSWILTFATEQFTYGEIQQILGNPSKKTIRKALLKYNPDLINN